MVTPSQRGRRCKDIPGETAQTPARGLTWPNQARASGPGTPLPLSQIHMQHGTSAQKQCARPLDGTSGGDALVCWTSGGR